MYGTKDETQLSYVHIGHEEDNDSDSDIDTEYDIYGCDNRGRIIISYIGAILMGGNVFGVIGKIIDNLINDGQDEYIGIFVGVFLGSIVGGMLGYVAKKDNGLFIRLHFASFNGAIIGALIGSGFIWYIDKTKSPISVSYVTSAIGIIICLIASCIIEICNKDVPTFYYKNIKSMTIGTFVLGNFGLMVGRIFTVNHQATNICGSIGAAIGLLSGALYCYICQKLNLPTPKQILTFFSL